MKLLTSLTAFAFSLLALPLASSGLPWSGDFHVIRGDCLWTIADISFNDPYLWPLIYDANPSLISNPDRIEPGWRLSMPLDPSETEMADARRSAYLYKETQPVPQQAAAPYQPALPVALSDETSSPARTPLPVDMADLTPIAYALYLLMVAFGVGVVSIRHMLDVPHHEVESLSPQGLHLAPWASIDEISGHAIPETYEEELKEAA